MAAVQYQQFEVVIGVILSPESDLAARRAAEQQLLNLKASSPVLLAELLLAVISGHGNEAFRGFAAVALRRDIDEVWDPLSAEGQLQLKAQLLQRLAPPPAGEPKARIRKNIADVVGRLGWDQVEDGSWPELLPALFATLSNAQPGSERDAGVVESWKTAFYVLGVLSQRLANTSLKPHFPALQSAHFARFLSATYPLGVRVAALKCLCAIVVYAAEGSLLMSRVEGAGAAAAAAAAASVAKSGKEETVAFRILVPAMLAVLKAAVDDEDDAHVDDDFVQDVLGCFVEIADVNSHFFRAHLRDVCGAMSFIGSDGDQEPGK